VTTVEGVVSYSSTITIRVRDGTVLIAGTWTFTPA